MTKVLMHNRNGALDIDHYQSLSKIWRPQDHALATPPDELLQESFFANLPIGSSPVADAQAPIVAVVGVGYVGVHIVESFARHYEVIAYDVSDSQLEAAKSRLTACNITFTSSPPTLSLATHFLVSVPTLLSPSGSIDTTFIQSALTTIATHASAGSTVVVESSVSVGMTRRLLADIARLRNLKAGMSPERVDPGRTSPAFEDIPKIISGLDDVVPGSLEGIRELYSRVFPNLVCVSSPEVAEMAKLYENCQRMVCVAFANEMADACDSLGIDPFEVSEASATKPFGYLPMSPSAGVGGHCIPVNPHYLFATSHFPILRQATSQMARRPKKVANRAMQRLKLRRRLRSCEEGKPRVLVVGMSFKKGQSVLSHSPGVAVAEHLQRHHEVDLTWCDPLVSQEKIPHISKFDDERYWTPKELARFALILIVMKQVGLSFEILHIAWDFFNNHHAALWGTERWYGCLRPALEGPQRYVALVNDYVSLSASEKSSSGLVSSLDIAESFKLPDLEPQGDEVAPSLRCMVRKDDSLFFPPPAYAKTAAGSDNLLSRWNMDAASTLAIHILSVQPSNRAADMYASPGGKSIALAQCIWAVGVLSTFLSSSKSNADCAKSRTLIN